MWEDYLSFIAHFAGLCDIHTSNKNTESVILVRKSDLKWIVWWEKVITFVLPIFL